MTTRPDRQPTTAQRLTDGVLVIIVLLVGTMAGAASFTHVHDWTINNSPTGTGDWFGWANSVITELVPVAALIVIARRRKTGAPIGYPMLLLVVAVGLSLTAQLAVAEPTVFGWMVSALPALAFFALSKLVFTQTRPPNQVPARSPATIAPAPSTFDTAAPAMARPVADDDHGHQAHPQHAHDTVSDSTAKKTPAPASPEPDPSTEPARPGTAPAPRPVNVPTALLPGARIIADAHRKAYGEPITPGQLAVRMRVPTHTATDILTALTTQPTTNSQPHNGNPVGVTL